MVEIPERNMLNLSVILHILTKAVLVFILREKCITGNMDSLSDWMDRNQVLTATHAEEL